jgi:hypothetical protein
MTRVRRPALAAALLLVLPALAAAQSPSWTGTLTAGWTGVVDDSTKNYLVLGGSLLKQVTPRLRFGPELTVLRNASLITDRVIVVTANVTYDLRKSAPDVRGGVVPFLVGGGGVMFGRDRVNNGPFWWRDPAFTGGLGVRVSLNDMAEVGAEYRLGWELHQRVTASLGMKW